jgi:hypothetical protein
MMTHRTRLILSLLILTAALAAGPEGALAYGGPGSIISGIGAFLAAVAALFAALFGFIWFPLKRLYQKMTGEDPSGEEATVASGEERTETP